MLLAAASLAGRSHTALLAAALILSHIIAPPLEAQTTGTIAGRVTSGADGTPLASVVVRVEGTSIGALTDEGGRYTIQGVPDGIISVSAQRVGLVRVVRTATVAAGATITLDFILASQAAIMAPTVITVTRELQRRDEATVAIEVLQGDEIRRTRAAHPAQLLNRLAGVHVSELSGEGHSMSIRQPVTTKPMYLYLEDGVPTRATGFFNHNALYEVNVPQSGGIEVIKGPGTALYGSDAIGGVINVLTRGAPAVPSIEATVEGGGNGHARLLASGGAIRGNHGLRADFNATRSDGWRDASRYTRYSGTVRWDWSGASGLSARTVVTASDIDQNDVAAIGQAAFDDQPSLNISPIAYRSVTAVRASTALELDRGTVLWSLTPFARYNTLALIPSWQLSYDPQDWDTRNRSIGALFKVRHDLDGLRSRVIAGVDLDYSPGSFIARQLITSRDGGVWSSYTIGDTHYDYDVTYRAASPYAQVEVMPTSQLTLEAGVRWDAAGYDYRTHLAPLATGMHRRPVDTTLTYTHLSPKLGLTWRPLREVNLFASYRNGFRAPSQGQLFQQNTAANSVGLSPVNVNAVEIGLRGELAGRAAYQLGVYDMRISNDILTYITPLNTREATNAGRTSHRGIEASLSLALSESVRLDGSYSLSTQRYVSWVPQAARPATGDQPAIDEVRHDGNLMEGAPRDLGSLLISWSPALLRDGRVAAELTRTGKYYMDPENTATYGGHEVVNLHANGRIHRDVELFARMTNVLDTRFAETATYNAFQGAQYQPGRGRAFFAGLRLDWSR